MASKWEREFLEQHNGKFEVEHADQEQPYSYIFLSLQLKNGDGSDKVYYGRGFSKVMHPDDWNPIEGLRIAEVRAARSIARQVLGIEDGWTAVYNCKHVPAALVCGHCGEQYTEGYTHEGQQSNPAAADG